VNLWMKKKVERIFVETVSLTPWACYDVFKKESTFSFEPPKKPLRWVVGGAPCPYELAK
jgi:hypothetical protein